MTGDAERAEEALARAQTSADANLGQLRNEDQRHVWLARRIREACRGAASPALPAEAPPVAEAGPHPVGEIPSIGDHSIPRMFCRLPERERTALALFYLTLFELGQIAEVLEMSLEATAAIIGNGRELLKELEAAPSPARADSVP